MYRENIYIDTINVLYVSTNIANIYTLSNKIIKKIIINLLLF
jgi:hypothetical protein